MKQAIPDWFLKPVQAYDRALSVRWCPVVGQFALERDMHDSSQSTIDRLKAVFHRYSNRKIRYGLSKRIHDKAESRRREYAERLNSLHLRKRIIFFIEALNPATLNATLFTLKTTDLWNHGGSSFDGNVEKHGNQVAGSMDYNEEFERQQREAKFRRDIRYHGLDAWLDTKRRAGERITNPGLVAIPKPVIVVPKS